MTASDATRALARALAFRAGQPDTPAGTATAHLRRRLMGHAPPPAAAAEAIRLTTRLMAIPMSGMPPATDDVSLLLDALVFRLGATSRADAWRSIGINPDTGRGLLARNANAVTWPIWKTLRDAALL